MKPDELSIGRGIVVEFDELPPLFEFSMASSIELSCITPSGLSSPKSSGVLVVSELQLTPMYATASSTTQTDPIITSSFWFSINSHIHQAQPSAENPVKRIVV
jgi:hypothetical protein